MNFISRTRVVLQNSVVVLLLIAAPVAMARNQKTDKTGSSVSQSARKENIPDRRPSAPAVRPSTPAASRTSPTTRPLSNGVSHGTNTTTMPREAPGKGETAGGKTGTKISGSNETRSVAKGTAATGDAATRATNRTSVDRPGARREISLKGGGAARILNGQIRSIDRNGMHIEHGLNGSRRIETIRNGAQVVSTSKNSGYVQRPYVTRNGHTYVSRTTVVNNVTYTSVYRSYSYRGYCCYYAYYPAYYYAPVYYGWAYNPWPAPVYYGWGWSAAPWYGYYGWYFAPYPVYPSAAFWLADYLIAANLQAAYAAQADANASAYLAPEQTQANAGSAAPAPSVTLSPEVKQAIVEEVKAQLAAEQAAVKAGSSAGQQPAPSREEVPAALDPARRTFVVATDLAVAADGQECELTEGDVITRLSDAPDQDRRVTASVSASKKGDCSAGQQVAVRVDDLQEMHNHFQEQLDKGMEVLASKQGTAGLPAAPENRTVASEIPPAPADPTAAKALEDQQATAEQTEAQVVKEAFNQGM